MSKRSENQHFSKVSVMQFRGSFSICYLPSYADTKGLLDFYSLLLPFVLVIDFSGFEFRKCLCSWPLPSLRSTDPQALQRGRDFVRLSPSPLAWPPPPETGLRLGHSPSQKSSMTSRYLFFFFSSVFSNPGLLFQAHLTCPSYLCDFLITLPPVPKIIPPSPGRS